jgi:adenylate cyclase
LETAFGLNAGEVVVGNIGSQTRTKYGIVGGPVNLTSRIQAQAEGGEILVSQAVDIFWPRT